MKKWNIDKQKLKATQKITLKFFLAVCICVVCVYVFAFGFKKAKQFVLYNKTTANSVVYNVWHIETFEGGSAPRINYLKKIAREIERQNPAVLFHIQQIDATKLADNLEAGLPDIISFGSGVGKLVLDKLETFESDFGVRKSLLDSGKFNGKIYALAYIVSGYAMFSHGEKEESIEYGTTGFVNPQKAIDNAKLPVKNFGTPFETYKNFVYHHNHALLGSARDVFRIDNLNKIGRTNASITPVDSFTDLVQYIGRTKTDKIINLFCNKMLSQTEQNKLADYHLFSTLNTKLYTDGIYSDMENAIFNCKIQNVFN